MITEKQIKTLIGKHLEGSEMFLVDLVVKPGNKVAVFIDGDHRVTIEACRNLSRFLEENLDRETEDFDLTVSSSGADRPLKLLRQYKKNIGNDLDVVTNTGDKITGKVLNAGEDGIEIEQQTVKKSGKPLEKMIISLKFDEIKSAKEVISFKK